MFPNKTIETLWYMHCPKLHTGEKIQMLFTSHFSRGFYSLDVASKWRRDEFLTSGSHKTDSGLVLIECLSLRILRLSHNRLTLHNQKECRVQQPLSWPMAWHTFHKRQMTKFWCLQKRDRSPVFLSVFFYFIRYWDHLSLHKHMTQRETLIQSRRKRKKSDSVQWQKPLHPQTSPKTLPKFRLRNDCGPT